MTVVAVLQARTGSSRLPAKALLDFHGLPLAILAAKRAASTGHAVIVATSDDPADDHLAQTCVDHGIEVFRGPLDNVLQRFVSALAEYPDDTPVVRLTGDNIVPDGSFLDLLLDEFKERRLRYLGTASAETGLPYGLSAEIFYLSDLRQANAETDSSFDREHVTPWLKRAFGSTMTTQFTKLARGHNRVTVDTLDDYLSLQKIFPDTQDPVSIPWTDIVGLVDHGLYQPTSRRPAEKFVLGGAQLGMPYGIVSAGQPDQARSTHIIKTAIANGASTIDTARAYGESEKVIGKALATGWEDRASVVTKLPPDLGLPDDAADYAVELAVRNSIQASCLALGQPKLDCVLLHRANQMTAFGGTIWSSLMQMKESGTVGSIGVSVQSADELTQALDNGDVDHVQMPYNILDHRWEEMVPAILAARDARPLKIHVRSALLQGLLTSNDSDLWARAHITDHGAVGRWLDSMMQQTGRTDRIDLCLAWARSQPWIDGVVVGVDNIDQLHQNLQYFRKPVLEQSDISLVNNERPQVDDNTLNPANWKAA